MTTPRTTKNFILQGTRRPPYLSETQVPRTPEEKDDDWEVDSGLPSTQGSGSRSSMDRGTRPIWHGGRASRPTPFVTGGVRVLITGESEDGGTRIPEPSLTLKGSRRRTPRSRVVGDECVTGDCGGHE